MFAIDNRTGNVITTVALFAIAAVVLYVARGAFFILLLSVLFACLFEPAVNFVHRRSGLGQKNRTSGVSDRDPWAMYRGLRIRPAPCSRNQGLQR